MTVEQGQAFDPEFGHLRKFMETQPDLPEYEYDEEYWAAVEDGVLDPNGVDEDDEEEGDLEEKGVIRRVRDARGAARFGQPIGSIIRRDKYEPKPRVDARAEPTAPKRSARARVAASVLANEKVAKTKAPKGFTETTTFSLSPKFSRRLATGERLEVFISHRDLNGNVEWAWSIYDPTLAYSKTSKIKAPVRNPPLGKRGFKTVEEATKAATQAAKEAEKSISAKRRAASVRQPIEGGFLDNWYGIRGYDWEEVEGEGAEVNWDSEASRLRFAQREADRLGVQITGNTGADWVEHALAAFSAYEEMFPGLSYYQRSLAFRGKQGMSIQTARGKVQASAYNTFRRAWGRNSDEDHGFAQSEDNPSLGPYGGGWQEVSLAFNSAYFGNRDSTADTIAQQAIANDVSGHHSARTLEAAKQMGIEPWQAEFLSTFNHEVGHTFGHIAFGHLAGATETTEQAADRRNRFYAGMKDIFETYDIPFTAPHPEAFAGSSGFSLDRSRITGVDSRDIGSVLSTYGATNLHELVAEVWAEYMMDPEPRAFARDVGDLLWNMMDEFLDNEGAR